MRASQEQLQQFMTLSAAESDEEPYASVSSSTCRETVKVSITLSEDPYRRLCERSVHTGLSPARLAVVLLEEALQTIQDMPQVSPAGTEAEHG
jgi:hypothetical protein